MGKSGSPVRLTLLKLRDEALGDDTRLFNVADKLVSVLEDVREHYRSLQRKQPSFGDTFDVGDMISYLDDILGDQLAATGRYMNKPEKIEQLLPSGTFRMVE